MAASDDELRNRLETLEDACVGVAMAIDDQADDAEPGDDGGGPFQTIIYSVLGLRTEELGIEEHVERLTEQWDTLSEKLDLPAGSLEAFAQRGSNLGEQLRSPPDPDEGGGNLVPLAETDSGRTIWAVNVDGWDEEAFEGDNVTLGVGTDGSIQPVEIDEDDES